MANLGHAVPLSSHPYRQCCLDVFSSVSRPKTPYGVLEYKEVEEVLPKSVGDDIAAKLFERDCVLHFIWECLSNDDDAWIVEC